MKINTLKFRTGSLILIYRWMSRLLHATVQSLGVFAMGKSTRLVELNFLPLTFFRQRFETVIDTQSVIA